MPAPPILQLYKPLEFLFLVAAFTTLAENFLPQLMSLPKSIVQTVGRTGVKRGSCRAGGRGVQDRGALLMWACLGTSVPACWLEEAGQ